MKEKLYKNKGVLFFVLAIFVLAIFVFEKRNILEDNILQAAEVACKGPADVMLLIDRSASMNENSKFSAAKSSSVSFIDKLFSTTPDIAFSPYDYHQAGLVAFNQNIDSEPLTQNSSYIKDVINSGTGILRQAIGYRNTADAIKEAKTILSASLNNFSTKTMIILTDGPPTDLTLAKQRSDQAKSAGMRIISIGLKLDGIGDETDRTEAEYFIKYSASSPADCYYVSDSGGGLADCNSISSGMLEDALDDAYDAITAGLCDNSSPVVNISRTPTGTLYGSDKLIIKSTAVDDTGFSSHKIIWSDNWPSNLQEVICGDLSGTTINCSTGELGPFAANNTINYRSIAKDINNNEASINLPDPRIVRVSSVTLSVPALLRNKNNIISVNISDSEGKANLDEFYIRVDNDGVKRIDETSPSSKMNCSGTGSNYNCTYSFNPGCASAGIYPANVVDIYIYAKSGTGYHPNPIASQLNNVLGSSSEGLSWSGSCTDMTDNDCDGLIDSAEISCDNNPPTVITTRTNPIETSEVYDDDASITLKSDATDSSGIKRNTIYYRKAGSSIWTTAFDCNDANVDGKCDEDTTQNVASVSVIINSIFPALAGTGIQYYSQAIDYSGNNNASVISIKSFIVKSRECDGIGDLGACNVTPGGKCCVLVCNAAISNPNSYNTTCAKEICNGTSWQWGSDVSKNSVDCSDGANSDGCYPYGTFFDGGCENRNYSCSNGYCVPAVSNRNGDYCVGGGSLILNDYECVGVLCALSPNPAIENDICDVTVDSLSMNGYNSDNILISGSSGVAAGEVLDNLTNKVSLISNVADINGISEHKIYWQKNGGVWSNKNCGTCPDGNTCSCTEEIGPYNVGDVIKFYAWAEDNSPNHTVSQTVTYSFTVRDSDCYDIPGGNKANLTVCGPGSSTSGKCCGGTCDTSVSSTSYDSECRVDACSGTNWIYAGGNEGNLCGAAGTCFPYYTGCISGNKCASGYCSPDLSGKQIDLCAGNLFDNYGCSGGVCGLISGGLNCSSSGNSDSDSIPCNCDCNGYDIEEKVYSSLGFDGMDDYVNVGDISIADWSNLTTEAWVYWTANGSGGYAGVYYKNTTGDLGRLLIADNGQLLVQNGNGDFFSNGANDVLKNVWTHIVYTYNQSTGQEYLYINGALKGQKVRTGNITQNATNLWIGFGYSVANNYMFPGSIDEVRVYNRALYPEEVLDQYNGIFADDTGLVGHWNFDEGTGEIANDSSGSNNNGTLSNADGTLGGGTASYMPSWTSGKYGSALGFDGSNDYVGISNSGLNPQKITLEAWVYPTAFNSYGNIINKRSAEQYILRFYSTTGRVEGYVYSGGAWRYCATSSDVAASLNNWNHIVHTYDGSVGKVYVNNVEGCSYSYTGNISAGSSPVKIGGYTDQFFKGKIDEVRIYNRAITSGKVKEHYKGVFSDNSGLVGYWNFNESSGSTAYDNSGNSPKWTKYYHNSVSGIGGNVPPNWQTCTDTKDNDCDGVVDEYSIGDISNAQCDGIVDNVFVQAAAKDRSGVQKIFIKPTTEVFDIDIERISNDFTLSTTNADDFGIKQTVIEWTVDNWASRESKTCSSSACYACVNGGTCENESSGTAELGGANNLVDNDKFWVVNEWQDGTVEITAGTGAGQTRTITSNTDTKITIDSDWDTVPDSASVYQIRKRGDVVNPLLLSADSAFTYRSCAWDFNNNKSCADDYSFVVLSSNLAPVLSGPSVWDPDFCADGLKYILKWVYSDEDGDAQASYEIQVKEGNNDFSDAGALIINTTKDLSSNYYQILSSDFMLGMEIEYGNKNYYWRVRATDNRSGGYAKTSDWIEGPSFTTPLHKYPSVDFSALPNCLYGADYVYTGAENRCNFGEDILFSDDSLFVDCTNPNSSQCGSGSAPKCDTNILSCVACDDDSQCAKFGAGYTCQSGNCEPPVGFLCAINNDCLATNISKCDAESGICVMCDDDSQCAKFNTIETVYVCRSNGKCEDSERRKWYFYGDDSVPPNSADPYPVNKYVVSVVDSYNVILKVKDISGNLCSKTKSVLLGGKKYPKWNEVSPANN